MGIDLQLLNEVSNIKPRFLYLTYSDFTLEINCPMMREEIWR